MSTTTETRASPRIGVMLRAVIHPGGGASDRSCTVADLSDEGARLAVNEGATLPQQFALYVPLRGFTRTARIMWRKDGEIGVEFVQDIASLAVQIDKLALQMTQVMSLLNEMVQQERP